MFPYNVRLICYPNGEKQLRRYRTPLVKKAPNDYENDYCISPFDNEIVKEVQSFNELRTRSKKTSEANQKENEQRSFNRTKNMIYEYSRCTLWEKFITFTFNEKKVDRYNYDDCSRVVRQWLHNQRRNAPNLQYLIVPELHKDGAIHFHGLLANTGNIKFVDSEKRAKKKCIVYNMGAWSYGWTTATDVTDVHAVAKYIGKYITKDLCAATKGKQRYFVSNNLPEPTSSTFFVTDDEFENFLKTMVDSLGTEIVHLSQPRINGAYVDVDYYELQEVTQ